jgi:hypothetical protein
MPRRARFVNVVACLGVAASACAPGALAWEKHPGPDGSARRIWDIRAALVRGDVGAAQNRASAKDAGAGDALLRELERGVVSLYAGDPKQASAAFDKAYWLTDGRTTRSISNAAASVVTSDLALPYRPSPTERALMHYYGALSWLARGRLDDAAVDARRLSALLAHVEERGEPFPSDVTAVMHDAAAALFDAAGFAQDARVERRLSALARGDSTCNLDSGEAEADTTSQVVLFIERGFVSHRTSRSLGLALTARDIAVVSRAHDAAGIEAALTAIARGNEPAYCGWNRNAVCGYTRRPALDGFTLIDVAWPELRAPRRAEGGITVAIGDSLITLGRGADISAAIAGDFTRDAPARISRAIARAVGRQAMFAAADASLEAAKETSDRKERNFLRVVGIGTAIAAGASTLAERADTRSWALLPDELIVERIRVQPGTYTIRRDGVEGGEIVAVTLRAGETRIVPIRDWGSAVQSISGQRSTTRPR